MERSLAVSILLLAATCLTNGAGPDNRGREFIIGYMENLGVTLDVELFVTTMRTTTVNVQVTAPRFTGYSVSESFSVTAGVVKQLFFGPTIRMSGSAKGPNALYITADDEVVMYGVNKERYSNDAYLALPTDVLGQEYYLVTWYPPSRQTEMMMVGINDTTTVQIQLPSAIGGNTITYNGATYGAGDTITDTLDRFDTLQLVSSGDLTGAYVTSDKPIGVLSGNQKTKIGSGGSSDHLCEFLIPVSQWGKNFITVPIPLRTVGDYFKFIASEDMTTVNITGGYTETFTISTRGEFVERMIDSTAHCKVTADKAISVIQFVQSQQSSAEPSDPAMMIIPPIEQYGADYTFSTPKYSLGSYSNFFMFVVKDADKDGLKLDGAAFSGVTYNPVAGTDYVAGYVPVTDGTHTVRHDSPIKIFGGYLYGQAKYETYAFPTGMRDAPINTPCVVTPNTMGDGLDNDCDGLIDEELCMASNGGADDDGDGQSDEDCATPPPQDGQWSDWSAFSACSITCESTTGGPTSGTNMRERTCTNPPPMYDGKQCVGDSNETQSCTVNTYCAVDGEWSDWASWGTCTVTCGSGSQSRSRTCTNPAPLYGGADCQGDTSEFKNGCNPGACPTANSNNYVQSCPANWFTCLSGTITCIEDRFKCDCQNECDDGSDETENYANCSAQVIAYCQAGGTPGGAGTARTSVILVILGIWLAIVSYRP